MKYLSDKVELKKLVQRTRFFQYPGLNVDSGLQVYVICTRTGRNTCSAVLLSVSKLSNGFPFNWLVKRNPALVPLDGVGVCQSV